VASRFTELIIDCIDPEVVARFWCEVLGYVEIDRDETDIAIGAPEGARQPDLVFAKIPEPKTVKNRLHIDVNATDRDRDDEVERLLALGATRADVGQTGEESWVVLADPEGNEFCVLNRRVDPLPTV
jgi:hypothetical protein